MTLPDRLQQIISQSEEATPGPWCPERFDSDNGYIHFSVNDPKMQQVAFCHEDMHPKTYRKDAAFIASSRSLVPALARALQIALEGLRFYSQGGNQSMDMWKHDELGYFTGKRAHKDLAEIEKLLEVK